jgi:hypothetical protein
MTASHAAWNAEIPFCQKLVSMMTKAKSPNEWTRPNIIELLDLNERIDP